MARGRRRASGRRSASGRGLAPGPIIQPLGPARRASRTAKRERRRRKRRIRATLGTLLAVVLVLGGIGFAVSRITGRGDGTDGPRSRTQQTLLFQVAAADKSAASGALLAWDGVPGTASMVLLPSQTVSEAPGYGSLPLGAVLRLAGVSVSRQAVSGLLAGVRIDHDWTLASPAFGTLVDSVGGVVVDVDRDLVVPGDGGTTVLLRAGGGQRLNGATALRWSSYVGPGEDALAALPRFQAVVEGLLAALPPEPAAFTATLSALGKGSQTSWQPAALATFLDGLRDVGAAEKFEAAILPVQEIETGGTITTYGIKRDEVTTLVERTLAASVPEGRREGDRRVIVENGVGTPGIGLSVAAKLTPAGYEIVTTRNAPRFDYAKSVVLVFDATDAARERGLDVARLLGLPADSVQVATINQSVADVIVIVGRDFRR